MEKILAYLVDDPLRLLYLTGGSGGIWFWITIWRDQIRIRINSLEHQFDETGQEVKLIFEVINCGNRATSLDQSIAVEGYLQETPGAAKTRHKGNLIIHATSRFLPPHDPKQFEAVGKIDHHYVFWVFKSYSFSVSQGRGSRLFVRSNPTRCISRVRYYFELALYLLFDWIAKEKNAANGVKN